MKNASQIINSIQSKPQFSKLSKYKCIQRIQNIFTPALQRMIKFSYIKNDTLFFVLNHPAGKQEFDNNIQSIKSALNLHTPDECKDTKIDDIKAFVTHTPTKPVQIEKIKEDIRYPERASGDFKIDISDDRLSSLVKSIQNIIKSRQ